MTFVSFETLTSPEGVDSFISSRGKTLAEIAKEVISSYPVPLSSSQLNISVQSLLHSTLNIFFLLLTTQGADGPSECLVIIDSTYSLLCRRGRESSSSLPAYLASFLAAANPGMQPLLLVIHHQDIPSPQKTHPYSPSPLLLLTYLATTILTVHSLAHILARKAANDRSLVSPLFGLAEELDGVLIGRADQGKGGEFSEGVVLEMEHRRKSGKGVTDWYFLSLASKYHQHQSKEGVILLDDHPLCRRQEERYRTDKKESWEPDSTFELGLTDRQRREREAVVLPYFDAQKGEGPGDGGRILYDIGEEDDFDDEEDET